MVNPKLEGLSQKDRLHEFFTQYIQPTSRDSYDADGLISYSTMQQGVELLLENSVFGSKAEIKQEALKEFEVIIPDAIFGDYHE